MKIISALSFCSLFIVVFFVAIVPATISNDYLLSPAGKGQGEVFSEAIDNGSNQDKVGDGHIGEGSVGGHHRTSSELSSDLFHDSSDGIPVAGVDADPVTVAGDVGSGTEDTDTDSDTDEEYSDTSESVDSQSEDEEQVVTGNFVNEEPSTALSEDEYESEYSDEDESEDEITDEDEQEEKSPDVIHVEDIPQVSESIASSKSAAIGVKSVNELRKLLVSDREEDEDDELEEYPLLLDYKSSAIDMRLPEIEIYPHSEIMKSSLTYLRVCHRLPPSANLKLLWASIKRNIFTWKPFVNVHLWKLVQEERGHDDKDQTQWEMMSQDQGEQNKKINYRLERVLQLKQFKSMEWKVKRTKPSSSSSRISTTSNVVQVKVEDWNPTVTVDTIDQLIPNYPNLAMFRGFPFKIPVSSSPIKPHRDPKLKMDVRKLKFPGKLIQNSYLEVNTTISALTTSTPSSSSSMKKRKRKVLKKNLKKDGLKHCIQGSLYIPSTVATGEYILSFENLPYLDPKSNWLHQIHTFGPQSFPIISASQ